MKPMLREELVYRAVKDGLLRIDTQGRIWRVASRCGDRWNKTKVRVLRHARRRAENDVGAYLQVRVMYAGNRAHALAHRLVYRHFKGPIPPGVTVNHKNGRKKDNRPGNLELATYSAQMRHAYRTGLKDEHGEKNPAAKLSDAEVQTIRTRYRHGGVTQQDLARRYGVTFQTISTIVRGDRRPRQKGPTADYTHRRRLGMGIRDEMGRFTSRL